MRVKIPTYQHRRLHSPKAPMATVVAYQTLLRKTLAGIDKHVEAIFLEGWDRNPIHFSGEVPRSDAKNPPGSSYVRKRLAQAEIVLEEAITPASQLSRDIRVLAARVNNKGDIEFRRLVGISPRKDLGVGAALDQFRDQNVSLIKSLVGTQLDEITGILANAEIGALRVEDVRAQIQDRFSVSKSKADLLARDQILKLNGDLTKTRQTAIGITKYIWTTSHDERVRGNPNGKWPKGLHFDLDGTIHDWAHPPICSLDGRRAHPGGDYQCRCIAYPVLPELLEGDGDASPVDDDAAAE